MPTDPDLDPDELTPEERQDFLKRLDAVRDDFQEMLEEVNPLVDKWLAKLAGPHLEAMLQSQDETVRRLDDADPNIRRAAVHLAARHWQLRDGLTERFEVLALADRDAGVRQTAARVLGTCYRHSKDRRMGALLASVVRNDAETTSVRLAAHEALIQLHGYFNYRELSGSKSIFLLKSLDDVCWALVEIYSSETPELQ